MREQLKRLSGVLLILGFWSAGAFLVGSVAFGFLANWSSTFRLLPDWFTALLFGWAVIGIGTTAAEVWKKAPDA